MYDRIKYFDASCHSIVHGISRLGASALRNIPIVNTTKGLSSVHGGVITNSGEPLCKAKVC
jgi:hypothetical protein